jgi:hypothetical protein
MSLVVCERTGIWAHTWRRELSPLCEVAEARTIEDAFSELQNWRFGALAVEIRPQNAPQMIELLTRVRLELPGVIAIAHLAESMADWELLAREAGVLEVVFSPRRLTSAAGLVERHLARAPDRPVSLREKVWQSLPWGDRLGLLK